MKKIYQLAMTACKVVEVLFWLLVFLEIAGTALLLLGVIPQQLALEKVFYPLGLAGIPAGGAGWGRVRLAEGLLIADGVVTGVLMALVFRHVHRILAQSRSATPFQPDNIRRLRQVGVCYLGVAVVDLAVNTLLRLMLGREALRLSVDYGSILAGLLVLCLTQFFARGMELEQDLEGLM